MKPQRAASVCASCGHPFAGRFCSDCGEERLDFHTLSVRHFLTHSLQEIFELDGKIWRTLRALLFRPGFLATEYFAGRRRLYVNPFRLLITAAILYAVATRGGVQAGLTIGPVNLSLAPSAVSEGVSIAETVQRIDRLHLLRGLLQHANSGELQSESAREKFHRRLEQFAEPLSFANVFMLALALQALFGRRRKYFVEHAVFSMHFMSFVLFTEVLFLPIPYLLRAGWGRVVLSAFFVIVIWQFLYLVRAVRVFYFGAAVKGVQPRLLAGLAAVVLYLLNSVFITCIQTLGAALAVWTLS